MKILIGLVALFLAAQTSMAAEVDGQIFYKISRTGEVVKRNVTLEVPSRGQGEVVLKGPRFEWRSTNFWTTRSPQGETLFTVAFQTEFMGQVSTIALRGTYLQGTNEILYTGNFFKRKDHEAVDESLTGFEYDGGFSFSFER